MPEPHHLTILHTSTTNDHSTAILYHTMHCPEVQRYCDRYKATLSYRTQSDALLANLYLENEFPVHLFRKLYDVLRDPNFSTTDLSFDTAAEFFSNIAERRVEAADVRSSTHLRQEENARIWDNSDCQTMTVPQHTTPVKKCSSIPPLVVELVIERILADATPFGVLIGRQYYDDLEQHLWALSRVHSTWTAPAQRALRPRARVALDFIGRFLLSPQCGPWITELAVYAPTSSATGLITEEHVWLFETLLQRAPNVRGFSFHTLPSMRGAVGDHYSNIAKCLHLVPKYLPLVENVWLDHDVVNNKAEPCPKLEDLRQTLVQMPRLKFLSIKGWTDGMIAENDDIPPPSLKEVHLASSQDIIRAKAFYSWLLRPRRDFLLPALGLALSHSCRDLSRTLYGFLEDCLPTIRKLKLCYGKEEFGISPHEPTFTGILQHCTSLTELDLFLSGLKHNPPSRLNLPLSLQKLRLHCNAPWSQIYTDATSTTREQVDAEMFAVVSKLPALLEFTVTGSRPVRSFPHSFEMEALVRHMKGTAVEEKHRPRSTETLCTQRGIRFECVEDAFPRQWEYTLIPAPRMHQIPPFNRGYDWLF